MQCVPGGGGFTGVKATGGGLMLITSRTETENVGSHTSTPPICLDGLQRDDFTFTIAERLYRNLLTF